MIDYRKIIGSKNLRIMILSALSWVPDKILLKFQYYLQTGRKLNLKKPDWFSEYIQAYKLYYRNPEMLKCVDKVEVRNFVDKKGFADILIPLIDIYKDGNDIKLENLPSKFVMKTSDGGGNNEVFICRDKNKISEIKIKEKIHKWFLAPKSKKHIAREWAYENGYPRKILIEKLLENPNHLPDIDDFKFFCFNGKFRILEWHKDRSGKHKAAHFDENLKYLPEVKIYEEEWKETEMPPNIDEMIKIAEKLSEEFPFVRVDLYNIEGQIYFGEMTFYPASGYFVYQPFEINSKLGSFFAETPFGKQINGGAK